MKSLTFRRVFFSVCACIFAGISLYSFALFFRLGKLIRHIDQTTLATIPVDFSKPGIYASEFQHDCDPLYAKFDLILNANAQVRSPAEAQSLMESLGGSVWIKNLDGHVVREWPIRSSWYAYASDLHPRFNIYERFPHGNYLLQIEVTNGAPALENHRQTLVFNYGTIHERGIYGASKSVALITVFLAVGSLFLGFKTTSGDKPNA